MHLILICLSLSLCLAGCKPRQDSTALKALQTPSANPLVDRLAFYDSRTVYTVYVDNWGKDPANGWNGSWNRIQTGLIPKNSVVVGSTLTVAQAQSSDQSHCDSPRPAQPLLKTSAFQLNAMGNRTRNAPKGNLLIRIPNATERFGGIEYLHMVGLVNDVTYMREGLAYDLIGESGSPTSAWTWAKLCIDNIYYGLYFVHERSDALYYKRNFDSGEPAFFYEGSWTSVNDPPADMAWRGSDVSSYADKGYELKGAPSPEAFKDLVTLIKTINAVGESTDFVESAAYVSRLETIFDASKFIRWAAAARLLGAWDNYMQNGNNFFIGNFGQPGTQSRQEKAAKPYFRFIPVDFDNVMGQRFIVPAEQITDIDWANAPLFDWNFEVRPWQSTRPMVMQLLRNPKYRALYKKTIGELLVGGFSEVALKQRRDALWQTIEKAVNAESDSKHCDNSKQWPFHCAHTGRKTSNHSSWLWTHLEDDGNGGRDFIFDYGQGAMMRAEGLVSFAKRRGLSAQAELQATP